MSISDQDLTLTPLRGKSGKAYIGTYPNGERIFVKLNTTPILPALAKEQIAPQLLWARRTGNGDMMSAQEWLDGVRHFAVDQPGHRVRVFCRARGRGRQPAQTWIQLTPLSA